MTEQVQMPVFANRIGDSWLAICRSAMIDAHHGRIGLDQLRETIERWVDLAEKEADHEPVG